MHTSLQSQLSVIFPNSMSSTNSQKKLNAVNSSNSPEDYLINRIYRYGIQNENRETPDPLFFAYITTKAGNKAKKTRKER